MSASLDPERFRKWHFLLAGVSAVTCGEVGRTRWVSDPSGEVRRDSPCDTLTGCNACPNLALCIPEQ